MFGKKVLDILKKSYPYVLLIAATLVSNYFVFFNGVVEGDDIRFHLFQITDLIYGFNHGYFGLSTNHIFMGGFAMNTYGFYGPVPHYAAAIISFMFGQNAVFGYKAVIILSTYLGGLFFYKLAYKISNNVHISIIAAVLFVVMPYRIFCAVCRTAFAEAVAICFIPLIFYGAYSIVHDQKYNVGPYIALVIGSAGAIMSHPYTGLMCAIFGVLYLAFNVKEFIRKREGFTIWPSLTASAVLILCLVGFYFFNALSTSTSGIYRLNDPIIDWTNYEHVADSTSLSAHFSGFLNLIFISNNEGSDGWNVETVSVILFSIFIFIVSIINMLIADAFIKKAPKNKYYRWFVNLVALFVLPVFFLIRLEIYVALGLFFLIYEAFDYLGSPAELDEETGLRKAKYNFDIYFLLVAIFICIILMFVPGVWEYMPSIFYQTQFAWRLWGLTMFFVFMLVTIIVTYLKKYRQTIISFAMLSTLMITLSQGLIEKRLDYQYEKRNMYGDQITAEYVTSDYTARYSGAQNEMVPYVLMDSEYKPTYTNSLWMKVHLALTYWYVEPTLFIYSAEDYTKYNPVFLEGEGEITITKYNSPNNSFNVNINSQSALIQFPQFYNTEYQIYSNGKYLASGKNVDGLVAFELPSGEYSIDLVFKNSKGYQIARPFFYVGLVSIVPFALFGIYYQHKTRERKKEES